MRRTLWLAVAVLAYLVTGLLTRQGFAQAHVSPMFWPPSGVALAVVLLAGRSAWPVVSFSGFLFCLIFGYPLAVSLGIAAVNTLEAVSACGLLRWRGDFNDTLEQPTDFIVLLLAALLGALLGGLGGASVLLVAGSIPPEVFLTRALALGRSVFLGMVLVTPLIMLWRRGFSVAKMTVARRIETGISLLLAAICGQIVLGGTDFAGYADGVAGSGMGMDYALFLLVAWLALRCGRRMVLMVLLVFLAQGLVGAFAGSGRFAQDLAHHDLLGFWLYLLSLASMGITLAVLMNAWRKQTLALAREKALSDDIIDSLPGVLHMIDSQGRFLRWNRALLDQTGYSSQEIQGKSALELVAEADRTSALGLLQQTFERGESRLEAGLQAKDGRITPYLFTGKRIMVHPKNRS